MQFGRAVVFTPRGPEDGRTESFSGESRPRSFSQPLHKSQHVAPVFGLYDRVGFGGLGAGDDDVRCAAVRKDCLAQRASVGERANDGDDFLCGEGAGGGCAPNEAVHLEMEGGWSGGAEEEGVGDGGAELAVCADYENDKGSGREGRGAIHFLGIYTVCREFGLLARCWMPEVGLKLKERKRAVGAGVVGDSWAFEW